MADRIPGSMLLPRRARIYCASVLCLFAASAAHAQEPAAGPLAVGDSVAHARQLFEAGVAHYDAARYADALSEFQEAYRLKPHPLVRVNIANCYDKLGRPVEAIENFEAFLAAPEGNPGQREEVRGALRELQKHVGRLALNVAPPGARVLVDEQEAGRAPLLETVMLPLGRHRISVALDGYETALRVADIKPQETVTLRIDLDPLPPAEQPPAAVATNLAPETRAPSANPAIGQPAGATLPPPATRRDPQRQRATNVWIAGGATLALAVTSIVTGQLALAAGREFDSNVAAVRNPMLTEYQRAGAWARGVEAANRADVLAAATDVLLGLTLVGAGVTTYFYLANRESAPAQRPAASLSFGLGRVSLHAAF
jgi:PEGA domain